MVTHKMGLFTIYDPPEHHDSFPDLTADDWVDVIVDAYKTTEFPWERVIPGMRALGVDHIRIEFKPGSEMGGNLGYYYGDGRIILTTQFGLSGIPFTTVHEMGHMVDSLALKHSQRLEMMNFWHSFRCQYHFPEVVNPNDASQPFELSHEVSHSETWASGGAYLFRHNEAFADAFVAAFNPTWWGSKGPYGRFVHWPVDYTGYNPFNYTTPNPIPISHYDKIRELTLKEPIMPFTDVPETHPHYEGIMWAAANNLVSGYSDGTFKPDLKVTDASGVPLAGIKITGAISRAAECTILKRYHDALQAGVIT